MIMEKDSIELFEKFLSIKDKVIKNGNELDDKMEYKKMIAIEIMCNIVLSKKMFKRNTDLGNFLFAFFDIELSKSMLSSRTVICGKIVRTITGYDSEEDINIMLNRLYDIVKKLLQNIDLDEKDIYDVIRDMEL